ncbi:MAG TPA: hypothetical protein VGK13_03755 [Methanocellaceae archaeon]|jgi:hypothetical protein
MSKKLFVTLSLAISIVAILLVPSASCASLFSSFPSLSDPFSFGSGLSTPDETHTPGTTVTKVENLGTPFDDMFDDAAVGSTLTSSFSSPFSSWSPFAPSYSTYKSTTQTVTGPDGPQTIKTDMNYDPTTKLRTTTTSYL